MPSSINYKHLNYFWTVAKEGSIAKASEVLHITPQTISGQLSLLEESLNSELFERRGRGLILTEKGRLVLSYAEEIFGLGQELQDVLRGSPGEGQAEFIIGIMDSIPKTIAYKIIEPIMELEHEIKITCREGAIDKILADLAIHELDMVLSDMPLTSAYNIKAYNHFLGESGITFFATSDIARGYQRHFPDSLDAAPMLLPAENSTIRRAIDQWFYEQDIYPKIVGQFDDSALLKAFGQAGSGIFFMPTIIEQEICKQFNVKIIGHLEEIKEQFYAISAERKIRHPAIAAICDAARDYLF